jgi:hypothetical protein
MTFRSLYAIGIGLALAQANSANADQTDVRRHAAGPPAAQQHQHHASGHRTARKASNKTAEAKPPHKASGTAAEMKELEALKKEVSGLSRQVKAVDALRRDAGSVEALRREMTDLKARIWGPEPLSVSLTHALTFGLARASSPSGAAVEPMGTRLKLPGLDETDGDSRRLPIKLPTDAAPAAIEERAAQTLRARSAVEEAKTYLVATATPGYTMVRQGVTVAIDRLHPDFAVKLAAAIRLARASGMTEAGVFSAYRPPAFGIGGFSDKFNSLHSYGLAADLTGIGSAGSSAAHRWQAIVKEVGLYLPYGPDNRLEFNHTQLVPTKVAAAAWRATITASAPKDLHGMWLASGISAHLGDAPAAPPPTLASAAVEEKALAADGAADTGAPAQPQPTRRSAPRRSRTGRQDKRTTPRTRARRPRARSKTRKAG